jgi:Zn-dependent M28 family amino/carboxypeptidase
VDDIHNHPGEGNFEAAARSYWPERPPRIESFALAAWTEKVRIPAAQVSPAIAASLLASSGRALDELSRASETPRGITPIALPGVEVSLVTSVDRHIVPDRNVLASIEGADPKSKDEWVVVCAHLDHNGADANDIFNGADDDGSGIVGLLDIAEAYALAAAEGRRPRRSVLFAAWNSEERGLLGAWAFTERPSVPLDRIVAVLNMDMIGRNEEVPVGGGGRFRGLELQTAESNRNAINVIGTTRSPSLKAAIERANRAVGLELKFRYDNNASNLMRRSDHWPFLQRGVPGVWFHTGLHPDYHTVYDRPEKINYEKMERIARLVHQTSWDLANTEMRPRLGT